MTITINTYQADLEKGWLKCRLISFFETDYYDDVNLPKNRIMMENRLSLLRSLIIVSLDC